MRQSIFHIVPGPLMSQSMYWDPSNSIPDTPNANQSPFCRHHGRSVFCTPPFFAPLLFDNTDSDCRDHCANERSESIVRPVPLPTGPACTSAPIPPFTKYEPQANTHLLSSIPILSPPLDIHDGCLPRHRPLLPSQIATLRTRTPHGATAWHHLLDSVARLLGFGVRELYEDGE
jgi:hypothetical protein